MTFFAWRYPRAPATRPLSLDKLEQQVTRVLQESGYVRRVLEKIMINTEALVASIERVKADDVLIIAALRQSRDNAAELAVKLQKAIDDLAALPGDTAAVEAVLASAVADLNKIAEDTETAVAGNPAVPDLPPTP